MDPLFASYLYAGATASSWHLSSFLPFPFFPFYTQRREHTTREKHTKRGCFSRERILCLKEEGEEKSKIEFIVPSTKTKPVRNILQHYKSEAHRVKTCLF